MSDDGSDRGRGWFGRLWRGKGDDTTDDTTDDASGTADDGDAGEAAPAEKEGWFQKLKRGLSKTSGKISKGIGDVLTRRKLDDDALEDLEDLLITADLGVETAGKLVQGLRRKRFDQEVTDEEVRETLAEEAAAVLEPVARPLTIDPAHKPHVVLVMGVNGSGKTTTIGKLARQYRDQGYNVRLVAGDTFRAAAVEQLQIWGERADVPVVSRETGADAAGLAYDALEQARAEGDDVLLIDTAGRLQNKKGLMDELAKIRRVLGKVDGTAPHSNLLVLDATVGQNAHAQVEQFREITEVNGLVVTKLDGTAKGGVIVALADRFGLPVHAVGVGEGVEDLHAFDAHRFARDLMGLD